MSYQSRDYNEVMTLVTIISDAAGFVRELKSADGKDIWLNSGAGLARDFFAEDLIDEIVLNVHPVLLGAGVPLFPEIKRQIDLELASCKTYEQGLVLLTYRVRAPVMNYDDERSRRSAAR